MPALDQWESWLKKQIRPGMHILAEIGLNNAQIDDIAAGVRAMILRRGINQTSDYLFKRFRLTYVVLLSGFAAHNTKLNFWGELADNLGSSDQVLFNLGWNHTYLEIIKKLGLPYFDPDDVPMAYVKTICFHGGIPAYSLQDFFEKMLLPSIERPEYREVSSDQVLKTLCDTVYFVDLAVLNFFNNSEALGVEFFEACRKLTRHYENTNGEVLAATELKLPEYVVEAFTDFMENIPGKGILIRPRKPVLLVAPYRDEAYLWVKLPEEEIPLHFTEGSLEWRVSWTGLPQPESRLCKLNRRRQAIFTEESFLSVSAVPRQVTAALFYQPAEEGSTPEVLRSWTLPVKPPAGRAPLLAFRANGAQVHPDKPLPESLLILIFPREATLNIDGGGRLHQEFDALTGIWQDWQMQSWNLTGASAVHLLVNGVETWLPVPVAAQVPDPELSGGNLFPYTINPSEPPLYLGPPPSLLIPLGPGGSVHLWQLSAQSVWNTDPIVDKGVSLDCLGVNVQVQNGAALLDLRGLLGDQPVGTYDLHVQGPGKVDARFRLRCWPKVELEGLPGGKFNPAEAACNVKFGLRLPENARCEAQAGTSDVQVMHLDTSWQIQAGPETTRADLNLVWAKAGGEPVRVPLSVPIARLRWALTMEESEGDLAWTGRMLQKSVNTLLQSRNSAIHVEMYGLGKLFDRLQLELIDLGNEQTLQSAQLRRTPFSPDWLRIPLGQFSDTLKASRQGRLDLVYTPWGEPLARIPLVLFFPQLEISAVNLSARKVEEWQLTWQEETPLKNRRVLIYPAWQPWVSLTEYKISDQARGQLEIGGAPLVATRYQVFFFIAPSWEPPLEQVPDGAQLIQVDLCTPEERLKVLDSVSGPADNQYCAWLERACILHDLGQTVECDQALENCKKFFDKLTRLELLTSLIDWMGPRQINPTLQSYIWRYMFKPELVKAAFGHFPSGHPLLAKYLRYAIRAADLYTESAQIIAQKADNPAVVYACLRHLLHHESEQLIHLVLEMIGDARLAERDAIEILGQKSLWAIPLLNNDISDTAGRLVARLIPKIPQGATVEPKIVDDWILRALPFVENESARLAYLTLVITSGRPESFQVLMQFVRSEKLSRAQVETLLSINKQLAFSILSGAPAGGAHASWLDRLCDLYPELCGTINIGTRLNLPVGLGKIIEIKDGAGNFLNKARIKDPCIQIILQLCKEAPTQVCLNLGQGKLTWVEQKNVWKCGHCEFRHPEKNVVSDHMTTVHPHDQLIFARMPPYIFIQLEDIEITDKRW